jgi:hypothetical protein
VARFVDEAPFVEYVLVKAHKQFAEPVALFGAQIGPKEMLLP